MGKAAARIGDRHSCPLTTGGTPHEGGPIGPLGGSPNVNIEGKAAARVGDPAICKGPPDKILIGSFKVFINGLPAARVGDRTAHGGKIEQGASKVNIG